MILSDTKRQEGDMERNNRKHGASTESYHNVCLVL